MFYTTPGVTPTLQSLKCSVVDVKPPHRPLTTHHWSPTFERKEIYTTSHVSLPFHAFSIP